MGAGPGASLAAYVLAKAGLGVIMFERGDAPGAKAMFGGVLYTTVLQRFFPDFYREDSCIERPVMEKRFSLLARDDESSVSFRYKAAAQQVRKAA